MLLIETQCFRVVYENIIILLLFLYRWAFQLFVYLFLFFEEILLDQRLLVFWMWGEQEEIAADNIQFPVQFADILDQLLKWQVTEDSDQNVVVILFDNFTIFNYRLENEPVLHSRHITVFQIEKVNDEVVDAIEILILLEQLLRQGEITQDWQLLEIQVGL